MRKRTLKVLTFLVLFIFLTSFFLNYSHTMLAPTWFPRQMVHELSENFKKLMKYSNRPCTCSRCVGQRSVSSWFDERFNRSMQPLLTAKNALLEEDTYNWWLVRTGTVGGSGGRRGGGPLTAKCSVPGVHLGPCQALGGIRNVSHSFIQHLRIENPLYINQS